MRFNSWRLLIFAGVLSVFSVLERFFSEVSEIITCILSIWKGDEAILK